MFILKYKNDNSERLLSMGLAPFPELHILTLRCGDYGMESLSNWLEMTQVVVGELGCEPRENSLQYLTASQWKQTPAPLFKAAFASLSNDCWPPTIEVAESKV